MPETTENTRFLPSNRAGLQHVEVAKLGEPPTCLCGHPHDAEAARRNFVDDLADITVIKPGEALIVQYRGILKSEEAARLAAQIEARLPEGATVLVIDSAFDLFVAQAADIHSLG